MKNWLHKALLPGIGLLIANLFFISTAIGQTTYYYKGSGNLNSTVNWGIATNGTGTQPGSFTAASQVFNVRNTATVTNAGTWTVSGSGSKITVGDGTNATNLIIPTGANTIAGTIDVSAAATLTLTNATLPSLGTLNLASTVVYNGTAAQAMSQVNYGNLVYSGSSTATFAGSGTYTITGNFSCTSGSVTFNSTNNDRTFNITGNFSMSSAGTMEFGSGNGTSVINLSGNFSKTNGAMTTSTASDNVLFNMAGLTQTMQSAATGTAMKWVDFNIAGGSLCSLNGDFTETGSAGINGLITVSSGGILNTGTAIITGANSTFTLSPGGTLRIGSAAGITSSGATGNIQTSTRSFNVAGNYIYNGTGAQATGNGYPTNLTGSLTINNNGNTVTLSVARTIANSGTINLTAGTFAAGTSLTMGTTSNINRSEGSITGILQGTGKYNVTYTGNSKTTGPELLNSGLNSLTVNESAASNTVTSGNAFTMSADLNITKGNLIIQGVDANYAVTGNFIVATNGTFTHSVNWDVAGKQFTIGGNIDVTGIFSYTVRSHVQMTGTSKTIRTGTPPASAMSILTLSGATVTANGTVTINDNFWAMFNTAGSFTTGSNTVTANAGLLNSGGTVNVNGGTLTVTNGITVGGSGTNNGTINISSGTVTTDGIVLGDAAGTLANTITQTGGTLTVNGTVNINQPNANNITNTWSIGAQTVNVSGVINFLGTATATNKISRIVITTGTLNVNGGMSFAGTTPAFKLIDMSGGAGLLKLKGALTGASVATLTAGTTSIFNYADNTAAQTVNFFGAGAYNNLHINTTGGAGATLNAAVTTSNVTGNLRVQSGTLDNNGFIIAGNSSKIFEVANGAFFKLSGTSAFPTGFTTVSLGATSTVDYTGSGVQTISAQNYGHLTTTLNGTRTITLAGSGIIGIAGVFTPAGGTTSYTNSGSTVSFNGTAGSQNVSAFSFNNLTANNTSGLTLTGNSSVGSTLTFTNGKITTGSNILTLAPGVTVSGAGAGKYVYGKLAWSIPTGTPVRTFYIGDASNYTPVDVAFTANITSGGTLTASTTAGDHPNISTSFLDASKSVNRYWTLTNSGISPATYNATFNFIGPVGSGDIDAGVNTSNLLIKNYNGSSWASTTNGTRTAISTQATGIMSFGDFQVAEQGCVPPVINNPVVTNVSCYGSSDGAIAISTTGGTTPFTYAWSNGASTQSITGLAAGNYSLIITATGGCTVSSGTITITQPAVLSATINSADAGCAGNDGTITIISPTGGNGTYEYSINGGGTWQASGSYTGMAAGTYNVQLRDAAHISCIVMLNTNLVIGQQSTIPAPTSGGDQSVCFNGDPEQTITASATGGTITWYDAATGGNIVSPPLLTGTGTVTYYALATSGSCTSGTRTAVTLTINASPLAPVSGGDETVCSNGDPNQTLIATATSPQTIIWYDAATNGNVVTPALIGIGSVTYYAEASNGTCTSSARTAVTLIINPVLATPGPISGPVDACPLVGSPVPTVYSIPPVAGATNYNWIVPVGATIVSGQGTTSLSVTFDNNFALTNQLFIVRAEATNACTSSPASLEVLKNLPGIPLVINGPVDACPFMGLATNAVYTIDPVLYATSYTWTVAGNATIVSGQGSTSIEVSYQNTFTTGNVKVAANSNCGSRSPRSLNVTRLMPASPVAITGPTDACQYIGTGTPVIYSIAAVDNATSYTWTVPANVTLVSGQGTTSITVTFSSGYTTSFIKVKSVSNCSASGDRTLSVVAAAASIPGVITGPANACAYIGTPTTATYTIRKVTNATSYIWSVPAGASITSHPGGAGVNDTIITVSFDNNFVSGTIISVQAIVCVAGTARAFIVSRVLPSTPSPITGFINACPYMVSASNPSGIPVTYTVPKVATATSYIWTAPAGAGITAHPGGSGINDTIVQVTYSQGFNGGSLSVIAANDCGSGGTRTLSIIKLTPGAGGAITTTLINSCPNRQYSYSMAFPTNTTSILWTVPPAGTIISGQGTTAITVSYTGAAITSTVTATPYSNCGNSATRTLNISLPACSGFAPSVKSGVITDTKMDEALRINVSPNPTVTDFKLQVIASAGKMISARVFDLQGKQLKIIILKSNEVVTFGSELKPGLYFLEIRQGEEVRTTKLVKF